MTNTPRFNFPKEIKLESHPLVEAWLDIRWQLTNLGPPNLMIDPDFPFALGQFRAFTRDEFPVRQDLPTHRAPPDMLPYVPRHRFRTSDNGWPVLQLGPGVATVNFVDPYSWSLFKERALYLRSKLLEAYEKPIQEAHEKPIQSELAILTYRNAFPYEHSINNLLEYLANDLNTIVKLPKHIPGEVSEASRPSGANISISFNLTKPEGKGSILLATGQMTSPGNEKTSTEQIILQLEVASEDEQFLDPNNEDYFVNWLTSAHDIIHEWFFAFIEGTLYQQYESGD